MQRAGCCPLTDASCVDRLHGLHHPPLARGRCRLHPRVCHCRRCALPAGLRRKPFAADELRHIILPPLRHQASHQRDGQTEHGHKRAVQRQTRVEERGSPARVAVGVSVLHIRHAHGIRPRPAVPGAPARVVRVARGVLGAVRRAARAAAEGAVDLELVFRVDAVVRELLLAGAHAPVRLLPARHRDEQAVCAQAATGIKRPRTATDDLRKLHNGESGGTTKRRQAATKTN